MDTSRNHSNTDYFRIAVVLVAIVVLAIYANFGRFDIGGEDGVYYTPAIAVRDGLVIHRDVFSQYGPAFAEFQAAFLRLFHADTVLSLRLLNSLLLVLSGVIAAIATARVYRRVCVLGAIIVWFASAYFLTQGIPMLAWPSVLSLLLSVGVLGLILDQELGLTPSSSRFALAGALSGLQIFVRANLGLTTIIGIAIVLLILIFTRRELRASSIRLLLSFMSSTFMVVVIWVVRLGVSDSLTAFMDQSVRAPADYYLSGETHPGITNGEIPIHHMARFAIQYGLPAVLVVATASWFAHIRAKGRDTPPHIYLSAVASIFLSLAVWKFGLAGDHFARFSVLYGMVLVVAVLGPGLAASLTWSVASRQHSTIEATSLTGRLLVVGFSLASVLQLYPGDDPRHLFWVGLLPLIAVFGEIGRVHANPKVLIGIVAAWTVLATTGPALENARIHRVSLQEDIAYQGIMVTPEVARSVASISKSLESIPAGQRAVFLCDDAQLASWFKTFNSQDRMYVTWSWQINYPSMTKVRRETMKSNQYVAFCGAVDSAADWAAANDYDLVDGGGPIVILRKSQES